VHAPFKGGVDIT